jgi:hypothetical protein
MIKHVPHLWDLFCAEIIVRSAKHVFKVLFLSFMLNAAVYFCDIKLYCVHGFNAVHLSLK